jgi:hypothetical protein
MIFNDKLIDSYSLYENLFPVDFCFVGHSVDNATCKILKKLSVLFRQYFYR